jgi:hypothetical protein
LGLGNIEKKYTLSPNNEYIDGEQIDLSRGVRALGLVKK